MVSRIRDPLASGRDERSSASWRIVGSAVAFLLALSLVGCDAGSGDAELDPWNSPNATSPLSLDDAESNLRLGQNVGEFDQYVQSRETLPDQRTKTISGVPENYRPRTPDDNLQTKTYHLKNADLTLKTSDGKVVSWKRTPIEDKQGTQNP